MIIKVILDPCNLVDNEGGGGGNHTRQNAKFMLFCHYSASISKPFIVMMYLLKLSQTNLKLFETDILAYY